jgi:hypothetical protein
MNCRTVTDTEGREFKLTIAEEKVLRAIERLEKMNFGRIELFGSGHLSVRINGGWYENSIMSTNIKCDGGDGGD